MNETILIVRNLRKYFPVKGIFFTKGYIKAVDGVTFTVLRGSTLALVGESGSGKSTVGRLILRLIEPDDGEILFNGMNVRKLKNTDLLEFRRRTAIVFQDPYSSLNPRMTVYNILKEPLEAHNIDVGDVEEYIVSLLERVGLGKEHLYRFPHEFSGGQRQRISIARVLALKPELIVLDEPTSSLDVSVQAQILNLLKDLQESDKLTYLFITHDLGVVRYIASMVAVMYLGKIVEIADTDSIFSDSRHPYTRMLLSSIPVPDPKVARAREKAKLTGEPPSPLNPPPGCRFHPRCPYAMDICRKEEPPVVEIEKRHIVCCHLYVRR
ncbi:MAG: ABC transporter ATP-binding protein [Ignisphaera sp.]|nr:ABC transporter ATP-binding protein [Ignisphaera sp.]MCX8167688.1 ABC transporter ATP-binding protein [Ignisphaera sp.]MDW8085678.1 ABC transporter ATP-binding protein [Ignisphaera sp.]